MPDWNKNAGGIEAFYFKDPDGHVLEVLAFPPGKGDPRWQEKGRLFLGIDHTAIVVGDTEASLRFYRDTLGMRVAGGAENYGTEQEHLNNVFGARLRITALRAEKGPGIEFLEYLAPSDGRPRPTGPPRERPGELADPRDRRCPRSRRRRPPRRTHSLRVARPRAAPGRGAGFRGRVPRRGSRRSPGRPRPLGNLLAAPASKGGKREAA